MEPISLICFAITRGQSPDWDAAAKSAGSVTVEDYESLVDSFEDLPEICDLMNSYDFSNPDNELVLPKVRQQLLEDLATVREEVEAVSSGSLLRGSLDDKQLYLVSSAGSSAHAPSAFYWAVERLTDAPFSATALEAAGFQIIPVV